MSPSLVELEALVLKVVNRPGGEVRLRRRVTALPDGEALSAAIAWERVEPATLVHQLVLTLDRRGVIPAAFLQALAEERPSLLPRLRALAADLSLEPPHEPPGQTSRLLPLARALTDRLSADPRPHLDLVPQAPVADTWMEVLLDADAPARGALLALCWPRAATPTRPELRRHLSCLLGASTLTRYELLTLTQEAGIALGAPAVERLDLFLDELLRPERTDERLHRLATLVAAALPPEEARALAIAALVERVREEEIRREGELDQALRLVYRALLRKLWAARRGEIPVEPTLDEALGVPPTTDEGLDGDARLDRERDLDEAEALTEALRFRVSPWDWLRAAALVQRASRGGLDPEQQARATQLQARLRPRLRWLVASGGVSAWVVLTLVNAAFPLYVWGLSSAALTLLLGWARLVAFSGGLVLSVTAWFQAILPEDLPQQGEPGHEDPAVRERAGEVIGGILGDLPPGFLDADPQPERWVEAVPSVALDKQGRLIVPEDPEVEPAPKVEEVKPISTPPSVMPADDSPAPAGGLGDPVHDLGTGAVQEGDADPAGPGLPGETPGKDGEAPEDKGTAEVTPKPGPGAPTGADWTTTAAPDAPITFVGLSGGRFLMGAPDGEAGGRVSERPQHAVTVSAFSIGRSEVTQAQWAAVVTEAQAAGDSDAAGLKVDPSYFKGATLSVEQVSWCDAARFANALSRLEGRTPAYTFGDDCERRGDVAWDHKATGYRLPTEAEWEYAARAGTNTAYATGDSEADLARAGWYDGNSGNKTHPVCTAEVKPWGLCDLHGNVSEWVWDWYDSYQNADVGNPQGPPRGGSRVLRGGSWYDSPELTRSALRTGNWPSYSNWYIGFRLVLPSAAGPVAVPEPG